MTFNNWLLMTSDDTWVTLDCYKHLTKDYDGGKFCKDAEAWRNICDGTWTDCLEKAKVLCDDDSSCYGIQMHQYNHDDGFVTNNT